MSEKKIVLNLHEQILYKKKSIRNIQRINNKKKLIKFDKGYFQ